MKETATRKSIIYRAELTKIYIVPLLRLQPGSTWSQPVDGQREASVTFGKVTTLSSVPINELASTGIPEIAIGLRSSGRECPCGGGRRRLRRESHHKDQIPFFELWPGITLESIDRPSTIAVRPLVAPSPPPPSAPGLSLSVSAVNGVEGRANPEPYKPARLCGFFRLHPCRR